MHHIYRTRAIILNSSPFKESDKQLCILARDFGLLRVIAQGIRKAESKLRTAVQDFSVSEVAIVLGRSGWRLTNANLDFSISQKIKNKNLLQSLARSFNLIERLVIGESDDELFDTLIKFVDFAVKNEKKLLHSNQISNLESIFVLSILEKLGYFDEKSMPNIINQELSLDLINSIDDQKRKNINKIINQLIRETGL